MNFIETSLFSKWIQKFTWEILQENVFEAPQWSKTIFPDLLNINVQPALN